MKRILTDGILILAALGAFFVLNLTGVIPILATIGLAGGAIFVTEKVFDHIDLKKILDEEEAKEKAEEMKTVQEYAEELSEEFPQYSKYTNAFSEIAESYAGKKERLYEILELTKGKNGAYIESGAKKAEEELKNICKRLEIKLIILKGLSTFDYQYPGAVEDVKEVLKDAEELLSDYGDLLVAAGKAKDDSKYDRNNIDRIVEKLEKNHEKYEAAAKEKPLEGLSVMTSGSNYGI